MILLVDDEEDAREAIAEILRERYDVVTASNGLEALRWLQKAISKPCFVLLDLVMPIMDGWQFLAHLRDDRALADISVVLISGETTSEETSRSMGLAGCIEKPIAIANLFRMLDDTREKQVLRSSS